MRAYYHFASVESTMLEYDQIHHSSTEDISLCVRADEQTAGQGRGGHNWHSPQGGLWFTFDLKCAQVTDSFALFAGHCLHKLLTRLYKMDDLKIKWTNDLYHQDRKIAGILCRFLVSERRYVIGIGINANNPVEEPSLKDSAISLKEILGFEVSLEHLMQLYIKELHKASAILDTPAKYLDYCNQHLYGKGRRATMDMGEERITGKIICIDKSGRLILDTGKLQSLSFGSLISIEP